MQPIGDKVLVETEIPTDKTKAGIIVASSKKDLITRGRVIAVGKETKEVHVGDNILFSPYDWDEVQQGDERLVIMSELDIWAKLGV